MYDVLLRGGTVIDPAQGLNARLDIAVEAGRIGALAPHLEPAPSTRVIDVMGKLVIPA
jgi:dihydroorotase